MESLEQQLKQQQVCVRYMHMYVHVGWWVGGRDGRSEEERVRKVGREGEREGRKREIVKECG